MKHLHTFESFLNEQIETLFHNKSSVNSHLDMRDFFRSKLGERDEDDTNKKTRLFDKAKKMEIDVEDIVPNQDYLDKSVVLNYQKSNNKLPLGVMFKDYIVIYDGHHRIAAEIINGSTKIQMLILKA